MTVTTYPAQRGREAHDRAEFDPTALAEPTAELPGAQQPAPDPRPVVTAVGVGVDGRLTPHELAASPARRARTLSILVGVPRSVWRDHAEVPERACAGLEVVRLDRDLDLWCDIDGAERRPRNPVASAIAAAFGVHDGIHGPVVFTGAQDEHGVTTSISVAASVLIAGTAAASDPPHPAAQTQRRREFAALGIAALHPDQPGTAPAPVPAPRAPHGDDVLSNTAHGADAPVWFDALAHTVTRDGDLPRGRECDEYAPGGHDDHQPEALADPTTADR